MKVLFLLFHIINTKKIQHNEPSTISESYVKIENPPEFVSRKTDVNLTYYCTRNLFLIIHTTYIIERERKLDTKGIIGLKF